MDEKKSWLKISGNKVEKNEYEHIGEVLFDAYYEFLKTLNKSKIK